MSVFFLVLLLYSFTLAPGLLWGGGDFATFQTAAYTGDLEIERGIFSHPLWVILAHPFTRVPFRDVAWRANFACAVFASLALTIFFDIAHHLTGEYLSTILGTLALAVSHTYWTYAVMPKVYSLCALLGLGCLWLLIRWRDTGSERFFFIFAFLYGLSFLNHLVMVLLAPGFLVFAVHVMAHANRSMRRIRLLSIGILAFLAGLAPLALFFGGHATGGSIVRSAAGFAGGLSQIFSTPSHVVKAFAWGIPLFFYQYPLTAFIGFIGFRRLITLDKAIASTLIFSLTGVLLFMILAADPSAGGVYVWNLHYYLLGYMCFAFGIVVGFSVFLKTTFATSRWRVVLAFLSALVVPVITYSVAPRVAPLVWRQVPDFRPLAGRDNFAYVLSPWKHNETGARPYGERILDSIPPDSVLAADYSIWAVVRYLQVVEGQRPDVTLLRLPGLEDQLPFLLQYKEQPNLFLADTYRYYAIDQIRAHFDIIPHQAVFRLDYTGGS